MRNYCSIGNHKTNKKIVGREKKNWEIFIKSFPAFYRFLIQHDKKIFLGVIKTHKNWCVVQ